MIDAMCLYLLPLQSLLVSQSLLVGDLPGPDNPALDQGCRIFTTSLAMRRGFTPSTNRGNLIRLLSRCDRGCRPRYQFGLCSLAFGRRGSAGLEPRSAFEPPSTGLPASGLSDIGLRALSPPRPAPGQRMTPNRLRSRLPASALCPRCARSAAPCRMLPGLEPPHRHPKANDLLQSRPCPLLDDLPRPIVAVIPDGTPRRWRGVRAR